MTEFVKYSLGRVIHIIDILVYDELSKRAAYVWMFLRQIDLTTALRPSLLPEETLLFVQDAVGLYEG